MKKISMILLMAFMLVNTVIFAQTEDNSEKILLTIDGREITQDEFLHIYSKNNTNTATTEEKSMEEYLELFINFKLKVIEAENRGLDTAQAFVDELANYRRQLAKPYMVDETVVDSLVRQAYERLKYEIEASHIMVRMPPNPSPEDTLKAWQRINRLRKAVLEGADFAQIAADSSDDRSAETNRGYLGYFSAFRMVYPFENVAYNTPVGEISKPVRTRFGYHIVKVQDKRPSQGEIQVAHIMVMSPQNATEEQAAAAKEKIDELYDELRDGADFAEVAKEHSEDSGSAAKGGELPWFGTGRMIPKFEQAAFALTEDGQISEPIRTAYGWHIIKRLDKKNLLPFEEMEEDLYEKVSNDKRSQISSSIVINRLKREYNYQQINSLDTMYELVDSTVFEHKWKAPETDKLDMVLFTLGGEEFTMRDFAHFIETDNQRMPKMAIPTYTDKVFDRFVEESVTEYETKQLAQKNTEFKYLLKEYHDGILLFELTDQMVWKKSVQDTTGLLNFYEQNKHKEKYQWGNGLQAVIYEYSDGIDLDKVLTKVAKFNARGWTQEKILSKFNTETDSMTVVANDVFHKGDAAATDKLLENYDNLDENSTHIINGQLVVVNKKVPPHPKALNEIRGAVTADYQDTIEREWLEELRKKYDVKLHEDVWNELLNKQ